MNETTGGWQCPRCGQWFQYNQPHYCEPLQTHTYTYTFSDTSTLMQILKLLKQIAEKLGVEQE